MLWNVLRSDAQIHSSPRARASRHRALRRGGVRIHRRNTNIPRSRQAALGIPGTQLGAKLLGRRALYHLCRSGRVNRDTSFMERDFSGTNFRIRVHHLGLRAPQPVAQCTHTDVPVR